MLNLKTLESRVNACEGHFGLVRMKRKINDCRRRGRRAPASHPWRQYKAAKRVQKKA